MNSLNFTGFADVVNDVARSILSIFEVDVGLAGSFDRDGQGSGAGLAGPYVELARLSLLTALQTRSVTYHNNLVQFVEITQTCWSQSSQLSGLVEHFNVI